MTRVDVTEYTVTGLPADHPDAGVFRITIGWASADRWAVRHGGFCLNRDGEWEYEPIPSERTDEFKAACRFSLEEATRLAVEAYPWLVINGLCVRDGRVVPVS